MAAPGDTGRPRPAKYPTDEARACCWRKFALGTMAALRRGRNDRRRPPQPLDRSPFDIPLVEQHSGAVGGYGRGACLLRTTVESGARNWRTAGCADHAD